MFSRLLKRQKFILTDGGLATELEGRGADLNDALWSARLLLENPSLIRSVHYDYFIHGADIAVTSTYQATFEGFSRKGINIEQAESLFQLSVDLAIEARHAFWRKPENRKNRIKPLIAASIGPYGAYLADGSEYHGDYGLDVKELMDFHRPRMALLAESGADLLAMETIPSLTEAEALLKLLEEIPVNAWMSFSCKDPRHICSGALFAEAVALVNACPGIVGVGVNCTPPEYVLPLIKTAAAITSIPLLAYPNSGETWDASTHCWKANPHPEDFSAMACEWAGVGARILGGCCRTTPVTIGRLRAALKDC